jgi:hypothetical protein
MITILNSTAILAAVSLFAILLVRPAWSYYALTITSLGATSIIVAGSYPALDEILLTVISVTSCLAVIKGKVMLKSRFFQTSEKYKIFFVFYLLTNTTISSILHFEKSNLRFTLLFSNILILLITLPHLPQDKEKLSFLCSLSIKINLYIWVAYWIVLKFYNLDWAEQQSVSWAGTAYAAIVPSLGLVILLLIGKQSPVTKLPKGYLFYYSISVFASVFYDSRVLIFAVILSTLVVFIRLKSLRASFIVGAVFLVSQYAASAIMSNEISTNIRATNVINDLQEFSSSISQSVQFINNPRTSDLDRSEQIGCSTRLLLFESTALEAIFGYGQNAHKRVMFSCLPDELKNLNGGDPVRPVGYAAYIIDFGLVGIFGVLFLLLVVTRDLLRSKSGMYYIIIPFWLFSFSLVTNNLDHTLVYQILIFDLLKNLLRNQNFK